MIRFVALSGLLLFSALGDDYFPPPDREGGWRTLTSAASIRKLAGIDGRIPVVMGLAARKSYDEHRPVRLAEIERA